MSLNHQKSAKFRDTHLRQKYNLVHFLPSLEAPALSGLYLKSFLNATKKYQLQLPTLITEADSKFCGTCGCLRIPTRTIKMHIEEQTDDAIHENQRCLLYTCLNCGRVAKFPLDSSVQKNDLHPKEETTSSRFVANWPKASEIKIDNKISKHAAKDRAKKRKSNTLASLLAKKSESQKRKTSSLNLESFMEQH